MIKALMIVLASVAVAAIDADRSAARAGAFCLVSSGGGGRDCGFYTFEQCLASRAGGSSHCEQNPNFRSNPVDPSRTTRTQRRR
jgi:hypothetical protein